jgi:hypothetical protein
MGTSPKRPVTFDDVVVGEEGLTDELTAEGSQI